MRRLDPSFRVPRISLNFIPLLIALLVMPIILEAQDAEEVASEEIATPVERTINRIRLQEFESILVTSLRHQFRTSGVFATVQSCRLPDYGPVITVTIQPPPYYFTKPVLQELERRQKIAEQQAQKIREQFDRTAQIVKLKAKEAEVLEQIRDENAKKKEKANTTEMQQNLQEIRKTLKELESATPVETVAMPSAEEVKEVDLNKMIMENYQDLVDKLTSTMKSILAENAAALMAEGDTKISISTTIRDNFLGNQEKTILFVLTDPDVKAFRNGTVDLNALKDKVLVSYPTEE